MREKFKNVGADGFHAHEMLEMLIYGRITRGNTNPVAHELLDTFGGISAVFDAEYEELLNVKGVGEKTAHLIKLIAPLTRLYLEDKHGFNKKNITLKTHEERVAFLQAKYADRTDETPSVLLMNSNYRLINWCKIGEGTVKSAEVNVMRTTELAVRHKATCAVIAHLHPSGICLPTSEDIATTKAIADALSKIKVSLLDHIILGGNDAVSLVSSEKYAYIFIGKQRL